jgi:hypothetical protein
MPSKQFVRGTSAVIEEPAVETCPGNAMAVWEETYNFVAVLGLTIVGNGIEVRTERDASLHQD